MKKELLEKIGSIFTENWVKAQKNEKIVGFNTSAEGCLIEQMIYIRVRIFSVVFLAAGIYLFLFDSFGYGSIVIVISQGIRLFAKTNLFQGLTTEKVSRDWRPIRARLLKQGVLKQGIQIFKRNHMETYGDFIPEDIVRPILVQAIDEVMRKYFHELRKAERDGFPKKEVEILSKMEDLEDLAEDLGLEMTFEDPTRKKHSFES